jgi:tetratricopeptide (TPR) repeat protein
MLIYKCGQSAKAEGLARAALARDPENADAHGLLSMLLADKHAAEHAESHGLRGVALAPEDAHAHVVLGSAYLRSGRPFKARQHLREALRLAPDDRDIEEAFVEVDRACRLPMLPAYYYALLVDRMPGKTNALVLLVVGAGLLSHARFRYAGVLKAVFFAFLLFSLYAILARTIMTWWTKRRPPQ